MSLIDSHLHVGFRRCTADTIIADMDRRGIQQCWLLTWEEIAPPISRRILAAVRGRCIRDLRKVSLPDPADVCARPQRTGRGR